MVEPHNHLREIFRPSVARKFPTRVLHYFMFRSCNVRFWEDNKRKVWPYCACRGLTVESTQHCKMLPSCSSIHSSSHESRKSSPADIIALQFMWEVAHHGSLNAPFFLNPQLAQSLADKIASSARLKEWKWKAEKGKEMGKKENTVSDN
jgi:hypothetical protein